MSKPDTKIRMMRTAKGLVPVEPRDKLLLNETCLPGDILYWTPKRVRSVKHNRYFHAYLEQVAAAIGVPKDALILWLKRKLGLVDRVLMPDGSIVEPPHSTSFPRMNEKRFTEFHRQVDALIVENFLPNVEGEKLAAVLKEFGQL